MIFNKKIKLFWIIVFLITINLSSNLFSTNQSNENKNNYFEIPIITFKEILYDPEGYDSLYEKFYLSINKTFLCYNNQTNYTSINICNDTKKDIKLNNIQTKTNEITINEKNYNFTKITQNISNNTIRFCRTNCTNTFNWNLVNTKDEIYLNYNISIELPFYILILNISQRLNYIGGFKKIKIANKDLINNNISKEISSIIRNNILNNIIENNSLFNKSIKNKTLFFYNQNDENYYNYSINLSFKYISINNSVFEENLTEINENLSYENYTNNSNKINNTFNDSLNSTDNTSKSNQSINITYQENNSNSNHSQNLVSTNSTNNINYNNNNNNNNTQNITNINLNNSNYTQSNTSNITQNNKSNNKTNYNCINLEWNTPDLRYSFVGFYIKNNCTNLSHAKINYTIYSEFNTKTNTILINLDDSKNSKKYYRIDRIKEPLYIEVNILNKTFSKTYLPKKEKEIKEEIQINEKVDEPYFIVEIKYEFIYAKNRNKKIWIECDNSKKSNYEYLNIKESEGKIKIISYKNIFDEIYENCVLIIEEDEERTKFNLNEITSYLERKLFDKEEKDEDKQITENKNPNIENKKNDEIDSNKNSNKTTNKINYTNSSRLSKTEQKIDVLEQKNKENSLKEKITKREINISNLKDKISGGNNNQEKFNLENKAYSNHTISNKLLNNNSKKKSSQDTIIKEPKDVENIYNKLRLILKKFFSVLNINKKNM